MAAAKNEGIIGIPGVEISSAMFNKELQIVGLFIFASGCIRPDFTVFFFIS